MRLDKFKIGSDKASPTHAYKNLKDVTIDFDEKHWVTVLIGWNGTGKSNVLEAISIIFRELLDPKVKSRPTIEFAFELSYEIGRGDAARRVEISNDPDLEVEQIKVRVLYGSTDAPDRQQNSENVKLSKFLGDQNNIPRFVFSYYSGEGSRLRDVYSSYLTKYDKQLRSGEDPGLKRLFFALPEHSQFVLLAFMIGDSQVVRDFLTDQLNLDPETGLDSVLFVLREPPWTSRDGDGRFWNARGIVQGFLDRLMNVSICPVDIARTETVSQWGNKKKLEFKYMLIKDLVSLKRLVGDRTPAQFFRDLESTYVSQLIDEVIINVRVKKNIGPVTFRELSEGERQLLTVLGLMRFTAGEESLFLLDEPDTHLNPKWSVDYLRYIEKFTTEPGQLNQKISSHVILTTHNPMAIAELDREQVQILVTREDENERHIEAVIPEESPKGMGYASIVTSDMFGIASTLDRGTQELLERQRELGSKDKLSIDEMDDLSVINKDLSQLGFLFDHPDDEYSRYLRIRSKLLHERFEAETAEDIAAGAMQLSREEREGIARQIIVEILNEEESDHDAVD